MFSITIAALSLPAGQMGDPPVLVRMLEVLAAVASYERAPDRLAELRRHANLVLADAGRDVGSPADLADVRARHATFESIFRNAAAAAGA